MQHTRLTLRNYSGFSMVILALGLIMAGFGAIDLMMIAPKGLDYVAAAGQGDVLVAAVYAVYLGVVDVFAGRLAIAEGGSATARRLPVLFAALVLLLVPCQLLGVLVAQGTGPALSLFHQNPHLIPLVGDYVGVRVYAVVPVLLYAAVNEGLKICGMKNLSVLALVFGFAMNIGLDWVFLYTGAAGAFASPTQAVSTATVAAQTLMAVFGGLVLARRLRTRRERMARPGRAEVLTEFASMARTAVGVGVRHLNDYAGTVIPLLFIGTMGVQVMAAAVIATKMYTLFCRVPQACFAGTFAYYGYALSKQDTDLPTTVRRLNRYAAVPTAVAAVVSLATATWLVEAFAGNGLHIGLARTLFFAYLLYLPVYFCEQQFGEMLTVHQRGTLLLTASTATTYILTVPAAGWAVFALHSAFWSIACKGLGSAVLAALFWRTLRRHHWSRTSGIPTAAPQGASHA